MLTEEHKQSMPKHMLYTVDIVPKSTDQIDLITSMFRKMENLGYIMVGVIEHRQSFNYIYHFLRRRKYK